MTDSLQNFYIPPMELIEEAAKLRGSLLYFTQIFYPMLHARGFELSKPISRESHYITIMRELVKVSRLEEKRLLIAVPPGFGKSTMLQFFTAWVMAQYPDSQILYISYSSTLAAKHTAQIKKIIELPAYRHFFGVEIAGDSSAKGNFKTNYGGSVMAFGSSGSITGQDAGLPNQDRFSGMVIIDDAHKPDEVHSDTIRQGVIDNYNETIKPRPRGPNVPIVFLGQRLHEDDLAQFLIDGKDGNQWKQVVLKALDHHGHALAPNLITKEQLLNEQKTNPYVFSAQYQQSPAPAGGGIFKREWFTTLDQEPTILSTFITVDSAETDKTYNDATVFSFWGLYRVAQLGFPTDLFALHWLDCREIWVQPKDLHREFMQFYRDCLRHPVKPDIVCVEEKSTGVTLASVLSDVQGLQVLTTKPMQNKIARFLQVQPIVASKRVTFPDFTHHNDHVIEHLSKITANNTHRLDDIADTMQIAIVIALVDKLIQNRSVGVKNNNNALKIMEKHAHLQKLKANREY